MTTGGEQHTIRRRGLLWPIAALAVTAVGSAAALWADAQPVSFGWFAYAPLSDTTFTPDFSTIFTPGVVLAVIGLVVLGFWSGLTVDARRRRSATRVRSWTTRILVPLGLLLLAIGIVLVLVLVPVPVPVPVLVPWPATPAGTLTA